MWVESDRKDGTYESIGFYDSMTCLWCAPQLSLNETSNNPSQINTYMYHEELITFLQVTCC